jgi:gentisate 1,2-dioxygenase
MRWYMHPLLDDVALRTLLLYMQEIPPGSRSGRQKCQGSIVFYVLEGRGYTVLDSTRYAWKAGDMINLPIRLEGITYQHFNADPERRAVLVGAEPNLVDALGVDKGSGFEELEPAPEYRAQQERSSSP